MKCTDVIVLLCTSPWTRACCCRYNSKLLHIMVANLGNYDQLRLLFQLVQEVKSCLPTFLVHQAWNSLTLATLARCWLKADILPLLHVTQLHQNSRRYHQQCVLSAIHDLCSLFMSTTLQSFENCIRAAHDWKSLVQYIEDPNGLATMEEWFTVEDSE